MGTLVRRLRYWFRHGEQDAALQEEIEFHRAMKQLELETSGLSSEAARFAARRELGNVTQAREDARSVWIWPLVDGVVQDLRHAIRGLVRTPSFTLPALAILVITMGMTTTVYAIVDSLFFRPWDVPDPERVVIVEARGERAIPARRTGGAAYHRFLREQSTTLNLAAALQGNRRVEDLPSSEFPLTRFVSGNYFDVLRLPVAAGRPLYESDDVRGNDAAAVIGYGLAERRFGGISKAVGQVVHVDDVPFAIVGVMGPEARDMRLLVPPEVWLPLGALTRLPSQGGNGPAEELLEKPDACCVQMFGRLKPDVARAAAESELQVLASRFASAHSIAPARMSVYSTALIDDPGLTRQRQVAALLSLAVALILLLGCANVGNLVLARAFSRRGDVTVRLWLGATRGRLVRHLLSETFILAGAGALVSLFVASNLIPAVWRQAIPWIPSPVAIDGWVLVFAIGLALFVSLAAGTLPAFKATRVGQGTRVVGRIPVGLRTAMLALQIAVSLVLMVSAALLARGIHHASGAGLGMTLEGTVAIRIGIPFGTYNAQEYQRATRDMLDQLERAKLGPVGATEFRPLGAYRLSQDVRLPSGDLLKGRLIGAQAVTPGFFEVLQIPLLEGRLFDRHSGRDDVVVERELARLLWPDQSPLGRLFVEHDPPGNPREKRPVEKRVIGVVDNARTQRVDTRFPTYYQQTAAPAIVILRDGPNVAARAQNIIRAVTPAAAAAVDDLTETVRGQLTAAIVAAVAGAGIAAIALLLTAVGTLGVFRYIVTERIAEIGVRKALGASGRDVILLVLRGIRTPIVVGVVVGLIGAQTLGMFLDRSLYGLSARDPIAYAAVFVVLTAVIVLALVGPARKAVRVDPASMLRAE